jgi:peptidyl-prolyl cis-trans isomerase D
MLTSIGKFSKSFFIKVLVGIIILPFVFWGMGDVFRGGNQNILLTIDSEKVTAQEFLNYLNRINLSDEEKKNINESNLLERILSDYAGKKIIELELKKMNIKLTDKSLKDLITNDKTFFKDGKFSRTEYEKFLLKSSLSAPVFEQNIAEQEKKRQLLDYLSSGVNLPMFLIEKEFRKENQVKYIKYINLDEIYKAIKINQTDVEKIYNENKNIFSEKFKSINYIELTPANLTGINEEGKNYFNKIDAIENDILDGKNIKEIAKENNIKLIETRVLNKKKIDENGQNFNDINKELFDKIFEKKINEPEIINLNNKYYLAEISSIKDVIKDIKNEQVQKAIKNELKFSKKLEMNTKIVKKIAEKKFSLNEMRNYAKKNNLELKDLKINSLKDNEIFQTGIIKRIFKTENNEINLITDTMLTKNYLIYVEKTDYIKLNKSPDKYKKYESMAKLNIATEIYQNFDKSINSKYDVELNDRVIDRVKNSL